MTGARRFFPIAALVRGALLLAILLGLGVVARGAAAQSIAVPAYFYPGGSPNYWSQLDQAGPGSLVVAAICIPRCSLASMTLYLQLCT